MSSDERVSELPWSCMSYDANNEKLKELVHDCLAVIIGWSWAINQYKGVALVDDSSPATQAAKELLGRAKNLGVET